MAYLCLFISKFKTPLDIERKENIFTTFSFFA